MTDSIFDYINWRGDLSFRQSSFNEVDGAILAKLSYIPFEKVLEQGSPEAVSIADAAKRLFALPNIEGAFMRKEDSPLLSALAESPRFRNMGIFNCVNRFDPESQTQFYAITIRLSESKIYVAFRGTDNTLVGWKEDFNMCFVCPVPAQRLAVEYLEGTARDSVGRIIVGGHSKGGNLAVYAAAFCNSVAQKRVQAVYNYDGPGFDDKVLSTAGYKSICGRVNTFVPQSSIIGMLLGHEEKYTIVHSYQNGILQHDLCSWKVAQNRFCNLETVDNSSRFIDDTLKTWLSEMNYEEREKFVDGVYSVICETHINSIREMSSRRLANLRTVIKSTQKLDDETREAVLKALRLLVKSTKASLVRMIENRE